MGFLAKIGKFADLFGGVAAASKKVENLGAQIVTWEARREALETQKAGAYSRLLDLREQELDGKANPDGLAAARAECADLDEQLSATSRKILTIHKELAGAVGNEIALRHETAQARLDAMENERRKAFPAMAAALAQAISLRDHYWKGAGPDLPFEVGRISLPGFDEELARLQAENADSDFLAALTEVCMDLDRGPGTLANVNFVTFRTKSLLKKLRSAS